MPTYTEATETTPLAIVATREACVPSPVEMRIVGA